MKTYLMINTTRSGYAPSQVSDYTLTVADLIDFLKEFDGDMPVVFRNDNGYTYGEIKYEYIREGEDDDE